MTRRLQYLTCRATLLTILMSLGGTATLLAESGNQGRTESEFRVWSSSNGYRIEARYAGGEGASVKLATRDGRLLQVPWAKLAEADRQYVVQVRQQIAEARSNLNPTAADRTESRVATATKHVVVSGAENAPATSEKLQRAVACYFGTNGKVDEVEAAKLSLEASQAGHPLASMWLARCHYSGLCGFSRNEAQGHELAQQVIGAVEPLANQGNPLAMALWASALEDGLAVARRSADAVAWYQKAADAGDVLAMEQLAKMAEKKKDLPQAVDWFRRAAQAGSARAMLALGNLHFAATAVHDAREAVKWYRAAAERDEPGAMSNLGCCYAKGAGVERDDAEAVQWLRQSATRGNGAGMRNLGSMLYYGTGVPQDRKQGLAWWRKAAEAGDDFAQQKLGELGVEGYPPVAASRLAGIGPSNANAAEEAHRRSIEEAQYNYRRQMQQFQKQLQHNYPFMYRSDIPGNWPPAYPRW